LGVAKLERNGLGMRIDGTNPEALINEDGVWYRCSSNPPTGGSTTGCSSYPDRIDLLFVKLFGKTSVVTSLTPKNSTILITDPKGQPASTGACRSPPSCRWIRRISRPGSWP
jgi:hypothetical protein